MTDGRAASKRVPWPCLLDRCSEDAKKGCIYCSVAETAFALAKAAR